MRDMSNSVDSVAKEKEEERGENDVLFVHKTENGRFIEALSREK